MRLPTVHGIIGRRLLVNFRAEPEVVQRHLPSPFRPKLHDGRAVAGICLIRLEDIRPRWFPRMLGLSSENAAHRIAVLWDDDNGSHEGVYIPRRDTGSATIHERVFKTTPSRGFDLLRRRVPVSRRLGDIRLRVDLRDIAHEWQAGAPMYV